MEDKVIIRRKDFPEWLKESEFYLSMEDIEDIEKDKFEVEKWLLLDEPSFDTVENIMHFLRIVDFCDINLKLYIPKIRDFMKDNVNYFSLISRLYSKNYGVYKEVLEEFEGPLFKIDVEGSAEVNEFDYLNIDFKIVIRHRNICIPFNINKQFTHETGEEEYIICSFAEEFAWVGDLLSNKLENEISLLKEWEKFKVEMKDKLEREEYLNKLKAYKKDLDKIPPFLTLNEKYNMISIGLLSSHYEDPQNNDFFLSSYNNVSFLKDEEEKIGFLITPPPNVKNVDDNVIFLNLRDLDVVKNEFYSVKDKMLKLFKH
jgi:hypothetical protein